MAAMLYELHCRYKISSHISREVGDKPIVENLLPSLSVRVTGRVARKGCGNSHALLCKETRKIRLSFLKEHYQVAAVDNCLVHFSSLGAHV